MSEKPIHVCLLGIDPKRTMKCKPSECHTCGWEAKVKERRQKYIEQHGLTLCVDGYRRLIVWRC